MFCRSFRQYSSCWNGECDDLHLSPLEQKLIEYYSSKNSAGVSPAIPPKHQPILNSISKGIIIIVAGPERSGSTWLYNAVRLLFCHSNYICHSYWVHTLTDESIKQRIFFNQKHNNNNNNNNNSNNKENNILQHALLIKTHEWPNNRFNLYKTNKFYKNNLHLNNLKSDINQSIIENEKDKHKNKDNDKDKDKIQNRKNQNDNNENDDKTEKHNEMKINDNDNINQSGNIINSNKNKNKIKNKNKSDMNINKNENEIECKNDDSEANLLIFVTHRNLCDVIGSYRRVGWCYNIDNIYVNDHLKWKSICNMDISFEDIVNNDKEISKNIVFKMAQMIGILKNDNQLSKIDNKTKDILNKWLEGIVNELNGLKSPSGAPDPVTKLWPGHRKKGKGDYKDSIGNGAIENVYKKFPEYMKMYGYLPKTTAKK